MRVKFKKGATEYLANLPFHAHVDDFTITQIAHIKSPLVLEIGVGKGDYLLMMAQSYPEYFFIGIELNASVLSIAAQKLATANLTNVLIITGDVKYLLPELKENLFDYIILNHSDPWPKKRHEKRRLTSPLFANEYYKRLKKGGTLIFKTDNDDFANYSFLILNSLPFTELTFNQDYQGDYAFDTKTEYENKFIAKGVKIKMIVGKK